MLIEREMSEFSWSRAEPAPLEAPAPSRTGTVAASSMIAARLAQHEEAPVRRTPLPLIPPNFSLR